MFHLTVAQAAAIINVAIVAVQLTCPLLITVVAVGILKKSTNAATWSVFGRLINQSRWPLLLGTDSVSHKRVDKRITGVAYLAAAAAGLIALAAVITPLGLRSELRLSDVESTPFSYVKDASPVGQATQSHAGYTASRICRRGLLQASTCPGNDDGFDFVSNSTGDYLVQQPGRDDAYLTTGIAANITQVFTGATGASGSTIAGPFDIQWRSFVNYNNPTPEDSTLPELRDGFGAFDQGRPFTHGLFRYFQQFTLENTTRPIEGLIVSTTDTPGIGLRNHTLPSIPSPYGYTWSEQILWLEPETVCANLNITFDYTMPPLGQSFVPDARLTDRGGFVDGLATDLPDINLNNTQDDPQLLLRSSVAARLTNVILARYLGDNSRRDFYLGKQYWLGNQSGFDNFTGAPAPNRVSLTVFGTGDPSSNYWSPKLPGILRGLFSSATNGSANSSTSANPVNIDLSVLGYGGADLLNISTIGGAGGTLLGIARMVDDNGTSINNNDGFRMDPGTKWSQPLYSCMSAVKASIKTVEFQLNGTASIANLVVKDVSATQYDSTESMPIWGMENPGGTINSIAPIWGPITKEASALPGVSSLQRQEFYLPAGHTAVSSDLSDLTDSEDAIAAAEVPFAAFGAIYGSSGYFAAVDRDAAGVPDASGGSNWLLYQKWAQLSAQAETSGKIIDFLWTDIMANAITSSKSVLSRSATNESSTIERLARRDNEPAAESAMQLAAKYRLGLTYDWRFSIPALVFAVVYVWLLAWSALMFCARGLSIAILRFFLNQTSAGRTMTTERHRAGSEVDFAKTSVWAMAKGDETVHVIGYSSTVNGYYSLEKRAPQASSMNGPYLTD